MNIKFSETLLLNADVLHIFKPIKLKNGYTVSHRTTVIDSTATISRITPMVITQFGVNSRVRP